MLGFRGCFPSHWSCLWTLTLVRLNLPGWLIDQKWLFIKFVLKVRSWDYNLKCCTLFQLFWNAFRSVPQSSEGVPFFCFIPFFLFRSGFFVLHRVFCSVPGKIWNEFRFVPVYFGTSSRNPGKRNAFQYNTDNLYPYTGK